MLTSGHDYLDRKLPYGPASWVYWLVSDPPPKDAPKDTRDETKAPINDLPKAFIGKDLGFCAKYLNKELSSAFLKENIFVVLDDRTAKDGSVKVCKFTEALNVEAIRATPRAAALSLRGNVDWVELRDHWEHAKEKGNDVIDEKD